MNKEIEILLEGIKYHKQSISDIEKQIIGLCIFKVGDVVSFDSKMYEDFGKKYIRIINKIGYYITENEIKYSFVFEFPIDLSKEENYDEIDKLNELYGDYNFYTGYDDCMPKIEDMKLAQL